MPIYSPKPQLVQERKKKKVFVKQFRDTSLEVVKE